MVEHEREDARQLLRLDLRDDTGTALAGIALRADATADGQPTVGNAFFAIDAAGRYLWLSPFGWQWTIAASDPAVHAAQVVHTVLSPCAGRPRSIRAPSVPVFRVSSKPMTGAPMLSVLSLSMLLGVALLPAQQDPGAVLSAIESEYWEAQGVASEALHAALDTDGEPARQAAYDAVLADYRRRFAEFATQLDRDGGSADIAVSAWTWVANLGWRGDDAAKAAARAAVELLLRDHLESPALGGLVRRLSYVDGALEPAACLAALRRVIAGTPHVPLRQEARMASVRVLVGGGEGVAPAVRKEALQVLAALLAESDPGPQAAAAQRWQFELEHLQVGMVAPDFAAVDQHGVAFHLSDYRGKVVVLDWWAFWCGACMQALPELRELAAEFADRPFAVIGVNGDPGEAAAERVRKEGPSWRSAIEGGAEGPLSSQWNVRLWPTTVVIDGDGVIRARSSSIATIAPIVRELLPKR